MAIFDDRLEIWNNGTLPKPLKLADLKRSHESISRNKLISKVFHARGLIETWGTGTNKMIAPCKEEGIPEPIFEEMTGGLKVIFRFHERVSQTKKLEEVTLSQRQYQILEILKDQRLNTSEIANKLGASTSKRTIQLELKKLETMGRIKREGESRSTLWLLLE